MASITGKIANKASNKASAEIINVVSGKSENAILEKVLPPKSFSFNIKNLFKSKETQPRVKELSENVKGKRPLQKESTVLDSNSTSSSSNSHVIKDNVFSKHNPFISAKKKNVQKILEEAEVRAQKIIHDAQTKANQIEEQARSSARENLILQEEYTSQLKKQLEILETRNNIDITKNKLDVSQTSSSQASSSQVFYGNSNSEDQFFTQVINRSFRTRKGHEIAEFFYGTNIFVNVGLGHMSSDMVRNHMYKEELKEKGLTDVLPKDFTRRRALSDVSARPFKYAVNMIGGMMGVIPKPSSESSEDSNLFEPQHIREGGLSQTGHELDKNLASDSSLALEQKFIQVAKKNEELSVYTPEKLETLSDNVQNGLIG